MTSDKLQQARDFEARYAAFIPGAERPAFHVTGAIGWINDPNGFSCYKGEYHLFYQYHPYTTEWGPMHWGHVKTKDFIRWERLPAAIAPDTEADRDGCFSGSAVELADGRQMLIYTGVYKTRRTDGRMEEFQQQCVAFGDGVNYEKYPGNPVLDGSDLPAGGSVLDFRDPKVWQEPDGIPSSPAPRDGYFVRNRAGHTLAEYEAALLSCSRELCFPVIDLRTLMNLHPGNASLYLKDGIHPNRRGYEVPTRIASAQIRLWYES